MSYADRIASLTREVQAITKRVAKMPRSFQEYERWMKEKAKEYKGKNKWLSSDEYRAALPTIKKIIKDENERRQKEVAKEGEKAMKEVGARYGDKVFYDIEGMFMSGVTTIEGVIVDKKGVPHVKLDKPFRGKRHIRWHKGFQKKKAAVLPEDAKKRKLERELERLTLSMGRLSPNAPSRTRERMEKRKEEILKDLKPYYRKLPWE